MPDRDHYPANRTYGRRKGHALSARKQSLLDRLLPRLRPNLDAPAPVPLSALFDAPVREIWLEVGFGSGEHLYWQAKANPDVGVIGCEPFINGVAALLGTLEGDDPGNVCIWDSDARELMEWLPDEAISRVFVLHPDPWPKARHAKRRFISRETLETLARIMRPGAELRIATDIAAYVRSSLEAIYANGRFEWLAECPADWQERPEDWPQTRYEKKALKEGRHATYLGFRRK